MASSNPFDLLGDDNTEELSLLIASQKKAAATAPSAVIKKGPAQSQAKPKQPKLPSKPLPPAQAVRESRIEGARGGGRGYGRERNVGGYKSDFGNDENSFSSSVELPGQGAPDYGESRKPSERRGDYGGPRPYRGGRRGGFSDGEVADGERPRRLYEHRSGTGRGNELKREGSGRGNWGTQTDELAEVTEVVNEGKKNLAYDKPARDENAGDAIKKSTTNELEEKELDDKEMTLEEYEKLLVEKRKALQALKTEGRKVDAKEFESMQQLSNKKSNVEIFIKLSSNKDKRKEAYEKEERAKKPVEGRRYYNPSGRGRGWGQGHGRGSGGFGEGIAASNTAAPSIEDPGHFPTLGRK